MEVHGIRRIDLDEVYGLSWDLSKGFEAVTKNVGVVEFLEGLVSSSHVLSKLLTLHGIVQFLTNTVEQL